MNKQVLLAAVVVWLLISFVPALSAANLLRLGKGKTAGG
jgi:hypothetical protein